MIRPLFWLGHIVLRCFAVVWLRRRRFGAEQIPARGRVLLISNHASYLDPPLVGTAMGRSVHFLARETLREVPVFGRLMAWVGTLFVDQSGSPRRGLQLAIEQLVREQAVCLFPEGTRTTDGSIDEFARGLELVLRRTGAPVVPVGLRGTFEAMGREHRWPRPVRVEVHFGAPIDAAAVLAPGGLTELRRRVCVLAGRPQDAAAKPSLDAGSTTSEDGQTESPPPVEKLRSDVGNRPAPAPSQIFRS